MTAEQRDGLVAASAVLLIAYIMPVKQQVSEHRDIDRVSDEHTEADRQRNAQPDAPNLEEATDHEGESSRECPYDCKHYYSAPALGFNFEARPTEMELSHEPMVSKYNAPA